LISHGMNFESDHCKLNPLVILWTKWVQWWLYNGTNWPFFQTNCCISMYPF